MKILATVLTVAAAVSLGTGAAKADEPGQLACQLSLAQFSDDVATAKHSLRPGHLAAARQLVDVGYGQCSSSPNVVMANITAMRHDFALSSAGHGLGPSAFWPSKEDQLSQLQPE
jgi:hypothetical protein